MAKLNIDGGLFTGKSVSGCSLAVSAAKGNAVTVKLTNLQCKTVFAIALTRQDFFNDD